jgi:hypothetical protein
MAELLYPQFLSDVNQYMQAEAYWRKAWDELVRSSGRADEWHTPWLDNCFGNGTPCRDGNPIFSAVSERRKLGVRIIQHGPSSPEELDFDWWVDSFGPDSEEGAIQELVISCVLSDQTAERLVHLLANWLTNGAVAVTKENGRVS